MGQIVVDASVVIAVRDADDAHHEAAKKALRRARDDQSDLVLPASAFAEALIRRISSGVAPSQAADELRRVFSVEALTAEIAVDAARLRALTTLKLPDALVVATGIVLDAGLILTCDKQWKGIDKRVRVLS